MSENNEPTDRVLADDAPDLSEPYWAEQFAKATVRRGRPRSGLSKISTTVRLDRDVLAAFRAGGAGWQSRINAALRKASGLAELYDHVRVKTNVE